MRKFLLYIIALCVLPQLAVAVGSWVGAPDDVPVADTDTAVLPADSTLPPAIDLAPVFDTAATAPDTTVDTIDAIIPEQPAPTDTFVPHLRPVLTKVDLETSVDFSSSDSMLIIRRDSAFMFGNS